MGLCQTVYIIPYHLLLKSCDLRVIAGSFVAWHCFEESTQIDDLLVDLGSDVDLERRLSDNVITDRKTSLSNIALTISSILQLSSSNEAAR